MNVKVKAKQWGNSVGIVMPREAVREFDIHPGEELIIEIRKKENLLKELWGALDFGKNWKEEFKQYRAELEGEHD